MHIEKINKSFLFLIFTLAGISLQAQTPAQNNDCKSFSPTEGVITPVFVSESVMKNDLLQMLANFMTYVKNDYADASLINAVNETCGYFKGENSGASNEQGVRPNADLSMICAFLYKYGKAKVTLPSGINWDDINRMARQSLIFAYSTHKANQLKTCSDGKYWGSTAHTAPVWESSLWAMSVAYSAYFQYDSLTVNQKQYIYNLIKAECDYELNRDIPTGYVADTKAEENGWETNILACALGLYPHDTLAPKWFERLRAFAINCYSHPNDATDTTVIDPSYDRTTVKDLFRGSNLYDDFTLQNHGYFHTSYQNVVIQELGESFLALKMFQNEIHGSEKWKTNALMHNNRNVMDQVIKKLALADGELAMPNGNDWSLFLYDQITSYATMACFLKDPDALMLENLAYKNIKARQTTTADGSWLLRPDAGARRMGVQAHRVMMTWLMHEICPTEEIQPTDWATFRKNNASAEVLPAQNIVRAYTKDRFTCFSWSSGIGSYTGYFTPDSPDKNKIVVPYKACNTGNLLGWYTISGKPLNASAVISGIYNLAGNSYTMNGIIDTNDASLTHHFALYSTPGNAFIYLDYVLANQPVTITGARGGLLAISTDEFTKLQRTIYHNQGQNLTNGEQTLIFSTHWANIDNQIGVVSPGSSQMGFGDRANNNSVFCSLFYPFYNDSIRHVNSGELTDCRQLIYYSGINAAKTQQLWHKTRALTALLPKGWNGLITSDPDSTRYVLVSNFTGQQRADMEINGFPEGAPVFSVPTDIANGKSVAHFKLQPSHSVGEVLRFFVTSGTIIARQNPDSLSLTLSNKNHSKRKIGLKALTNEGEITGKVIIPAKTEMIILVANGKLVAKKVL